MGSIKYPVPKDAVFVECRGPNCRTRIAWIVVEATGKRMPVEGDGTPHWANCKDREAFRKKRKVQKK